MLNRYKQTGLIFSLLALLWLIVPCGIHCQMLVPPAGVPSKPVGRQGCPGCLPDTSRNTNSPVPLSHPVNDDIRSICVSNSELLKSINPLDWQKAVTQGLNQSVSLAIAIVPDVDSFSYYQPKSLFRFPPGEVCRLLSVSRIYSPHAPPFMD